MAFRIIGILANFEASHWKWTQIQFGRSLLCHCFFVWWVAATLPGMVAAQHTFLILNSRMVLLRRDTLLIVKKPVLGGVSEFTAMPRDKERKSFRARWKNA